jgi:hypothetical protein
VNSKDKQVLRRALTRAAEHLKKQMDAAVGKSDALLASAAVYREQLDKYEADLKALGDES